MYKVLTFVLNIDDLPYEDGTSKRHLVNGDILPGGFTQDQIDFFLSVGFIEKIEENKDEEVVNEETPTEEVLTGETEQPVEEKKKNTPKKTKGK